MSDRAAWLAERRKYVCGSDLPAITGLSPFGKTAYDVACEKLGLVPDCEPSPVQAIGTALQGAILDLWKADSGLDAHLLTDCLIPAAFVEWAAGSPDGIFPRLSPDVQYGVEMKNVGGYARWWEDREAVPLHVEIQCQWYMMVMNCHVWHVAVLFGGSTFCRYEIAADFWIQFVCLTVAWEFWQKVQRGEMPEPTTPEQAVDAAQRLTPTGAVRWCNAEEELIATAYFGCEEVYELAKQNLDVAKAKMITTVGPDSGIEGPGWKITTKTKNGKNRFTAERK